MQYNRLTYFDIENIKSLQPDGCPDITDAYRFYCEKDYCYPIKVTLDKKMLELEVLLSLIKQHG